MNQINEGVNGTLNLDTVTIGGISISNQIFAQGNAFTDNDCPNLNSEMGRFDVSLIYFLI